MARNSFSVWRAPIQERRSDAHSEKIRAAWLDVETALLFDRPGRVSLADCVSSGNAEKLVSRET